MDMPHVGHTGSRSICLIISTASASILQLNRRESRMRRTLAVQFLYTKSGSPLQLPTFAVLAVKILVGVGNIRDLHAGGVIFEFPSGTQGYRGQVKRLGNS